MKFLILLLMFITPLSASDSNRILYLMQNKNPWEALDLYREHIMIDGRHDHELLQQIALLILEQGNKSSDPEVQLLTIFGAGISVNERSMHILEKGMNSKNPNIQLISMNFLCTQQNKNVVEVLNQAMTSDFFPIRLEAAHQLALMKYPTAVGQISSLMQKVPPEAHPIFPQLFAIAGNQEGIRILQRMLVHPNENVRIQAIQAIAKYKRDDLLPQIRILATHQNIAEQEVCALALGALKDSSSIPRLKELTKSTNLHVRLSALMSLYDLGNDEVSYEIQAIARKGDLLAINLLGEIPGSEPLLRELLGSFDGHIKVNACLSLLKLEDPSCLSTLCEVLIRNRRDIAFVQTSSIGHGLTAWKVIPSAKQNLKENPIAFEVSLKMREAALIQALNLPEKNFLELADTIFQYQQNDLVPILVSLLENLRTPDAIALLKKHREKVGAPLVRNYCNLALFKMREPGPYADTLVDWIQSQEDHYIIQFRPFLTWDLRGGEDPNYQLTPQDTSRLLIDAFQAFAEARDEKGIDVLLHAIQYGNQKNKYALAGLLMRTAQ